MKEGSDTKEYTSPGLRKKHAQDVQKADAAAMMASAKQGKRPEKKGRYGGNMSTEGVIDEASGTTHADNTYDDDHKGSSTGHHIDALHTMHKKDKHPGVRFHTAQGDSDPHAVSISHDSPARKSKTFMAHVKKLASVPHVAEEVISDKLEE